MEGNILRFQKYIVRKIVNAVYYDSEKDEYEINRITLSDDILNEIMEEGRRYKLTDKDTVYIVNEVAKNIVTSPESKINNGVYNGGKIKVGEHIEIHVSHPTKGPNYIGVIGLSNECYMVLYSTISGLSLYDELLPISRQWNPGYDIDFIVMRDGKRYPDQDTKLQLSVFSHVVIYKPSVIHEIMDEKSFPSKPKAQGDAKRESPDAESGKRANKQPSVKGHAGVGTESRGDMSTPIEITYSPDLVNGYKWYNVCK